MKDICVVSINDLKKDEYFKYVDIFEEQKLLGPIENFIFTNFT